MSSGPGALKAIEHEPPFLIGFGLSDEHNVALGEKITFAAREARIAAQVVGVPYGTDAAAFNVAGVPSIVFGPGSIDQAHTADEFIDLAALEAGASQFSAYLAALRERGA